MKKAWKIVLITAVCILIVGEFRIVDKRVTVFL